MHKSVDPTQENNAAKPQFDQIPDRVHARATMEELATASGLLLTYIRNGLDNYARIQTDEKRKNLPSRGAVDNCGFG